MPPRLAAALLIVLLHVAVGAFAESVRPAFDLAAASTRWLFTIGNVPVWLGALTIGGAYVTLPSVRGRWLVWSASLAVLLYVALELPAARYFGQHLSWRMLVDGLSSHLADSAWSEFDRSSLRLVLAVCAFHFFWAYQIRAASAPLPRHAVKVWLLLLVILGGLWAGFRDRLPEHPLVVLAMSSADARGARGDGRALDQDLKSLRFGQFDEPPEVRQALAATQGFFAARGRRPNVVFVVIESLGARRLASGGQIDPVTMPNLARLQARGGVLFDQVMVNHPETFFANIAMATAGRYPTWLDPASVVTRPWQGSLAVDAFHQADYRTGLFAAADLDYLGLSRFLAQGKYDQFVHYGALPAATRERDRLDSWGGRDDRMAARAASWLAEGGDRPFFLQFLTNAPHHPYTTPPDFVPPAALAEPTDRLGRYRRALAAADAAIGELLDSLARRGELDNTLVVVTGDHGEAFEEHGAGGHRGRGFDEAVRDFALFSLPNGRPVVSHRVIANGDLLPTAAAIAGLVMPPPEGDGTDRRRIQNALASEWTPRLQFFQHDLNPGGWGVRDGQWKYISQASGGSMLFDLSADPDEKNNLIRQHPERDKVYDQLAVAWYLERNNDFARQLVQPDFLPKLDANALASFGLKQLLVGYVEPIDPVGFRVVPAATANPAELIYIDALWAGFPATTEVEYRWTAPDGEVYLRPIELNEGFRLQRIPMPDEARRGRAGMLSGKWQVSVHVGPETLAEQSFVVEASVPRHFTGDMSRLDPVRATIRALEIGHLDELHQFSKATRLKATDKFVINSTWRSGIYDERLDYEIESPRGQVMPIVATLKAGVVRQSEEIEPPVAMWVGTWKVRLFHEGRLLATTQFEVVP